MVKAVPATARGRFRFEFSHVVIVMSFGSHARPMLAVMGMAVPPGGVSTGTR
jgi:hypothetical protein